MALINCPECGKEISDRVVSYPNCGCPASDWYAFSITSSVRKCNNVKKMCVYSAYCSESVNRSTVKGIFKLADFLSKEDVASCSWCTCRGKQQIYLESLYE
jgi:hypothetical protein